MENPIHFHFDMKSRPATAERLALNWIDSLIYLQSFFDRLGDDRQFTEDAAEEGDQFCEETGVDLDGFGFAFRKDAVVAADQLCLHGVIRGCFFDGAGSAYIRFLLDNEPLSFPGVIPARSFPAASSRFPQPAHRPRLLRAGG